MRYFKHLITYQLFESGNRFAFLKWKPISAIGNDIHDILLEINDEPDWKAECWFNSEEGKSVVVIQTEDEDYEKRTSAPPVVIETIRRVIDFMNSEGFTNYQITDEDEQQYKEITLEEVADLDIWSNNFIRIDFWK